MLIRWILEFEAKYLYVFQIFAPLILHWIQIIFGAHRHRNFKTMDTNGFIYISTLFEVTTGEVPVLIIFLFTIRQLLRWRCFFFVTPHHSNFKKQQREKKDKQSKEKRITYKNTLLHRRPRCSRNYVTKLSDCRWVILFLLTMTCLI